MAAATVNSLAILGSDILREQIAEIAPCSPLQEGVLLSPSSIAVYWVWNCTPPVGTCVDPAKLENSWRVASLKHSIFSTIFAADPSSGSFSQVILRDPIFSVQQLTTSDSNTTAAKVLTACQRPKFTKMSPRHALTICTHVSTGAVACRFDICHTLYDVYSLRILLKDVISIYHGRAVQDPAPFTDLIRYIKGRTDAETTDFWSEYLRGAKSCRFPILPLHDSPDFPKDEHEAISVPKKPFDDATTFCSEKGITRSVFMHIAWALVLAHFNGRNDVCFGYMGSGRDAPVDGINRICGPMANLLISRVNLGAPLRSLLQNTGKTLKKHRSHQQTYFAPVFHKLGLGGGPLFNTMINLLRAEPNEQDQTSTLAFEKELLISPHEFDLVMEGYLHPDTISITLYYRSGHISREVAEEVCTILSWAADFLVESAAQLDLSNGVANGTEGDITLSDRFCKYLTGSCPSHITEFWRRQLCGVEDVCSKSRGGKVPDVSKRDEAALYIPLESNNGFSVESQVKLAWAILLGQGKDAEEVFFACADKRTQPKLRHLTDLAGSERTVLPYRVKIPSQSTVSDLLSNLQQVETDMTSNDAPGLHWLRQIHGSADCFTTAITFQGDSLSGLGPVDTVVRAEYCENGIRLHLTTYSDTPIKRTARRFAQILRQLRQKENLETEWNKIIRICEEDRKDVYSWNSAVIPTNDTTINHLFSAQMQKHPERIAVDAWDGSLTYRQLDNYSTLLAYHLLDQGIKPGSIVVLCFEKSVLASISMLAVSKAGITGLGVDPGQPEIRLAQIVSESSAAGTLCSLLHQALSERIGTSKVFPVSLNAIAEIRGDCTWTLPDVSPSAVLYAVFTSGSTGKPKGVLVSQQSYSTAIVCQHEPYGFNPEVRVLDFSSYAFDAAWFNLMHTITCGGCLCVPSTTDLRNDLEGCISQYKVNFAFLTPSVCRGVDRKALGLLKRILLGGEMVVPSDITPLGNDCVITLIYGPSECTPMTMCHNPRHPGDVALGHGLGVKTWIVNADDVHELCPIGITGELCLEGPLIGDGYLGDQAKTNDAFITGLSWHQDPQARIYRTGDLVRYTGDELGTILYARRKDTQVKLRGQRVELGEVEQHVHRSILAESCVDHKINDIDRPDDLLVHVVAETISSDEATNVVLVAFVSLKMTGDQSKAAHEEMVRRFTAGVSRRLEQQIPSYMVPVSYIPVQSMPTTINGKVDRTRLRTIEARSWKEFTTQNDRTEIDSKVSEDPMERMLQDIWSQVLNLSPGIVPITKGFTSLGGDSITAMQVVSKCRQQGVAITVADILLARTIQKLALRCCALPKTHKRFHGDDSRAPVDAEEQNEEHFELSPIQQRFFQIFPHGEDHFNQSFMLGMKPDVSKTDLQAALKAVIDRHHMLRAQYRKSPQGVWNQYVSSRESWSMSEHSVLTSSEAFVMAQGMQKELSVMDGPVFTAAYFTVTDHAPMLLLSAHHLIVDLVSWRTIWRDLEDHIQNKYLPPAQGTSFRRWCKEQDHASRDLLPSLVLPFEISAPNTTFWGYPSGDYVRDNALGRTRTLDAESTKLLMGVSTNPLRTEPLDIILGTLAYSFAQSFPERQVPTIFLEGHGREALDNVSLDISDTVGWFTTIHPLPLFPKVGDTVIDAVCIAKDTRRCVPSKGQQYFASRFYSEKCMQAFKGHDEIELLVNFAGSYQQLESETGLFKLLTTDGDGQGIEVVAPSSPRLALIELSMMVRNNQLELTMTVDKDMLHQDRLAMWQARFLDVIGDAVRKLSQFTDRLTRSDVPLLNLSESELRYFNNEQLQALGLSPKDIMDAYPASPLQEGVLLSADRGLSTYDTFWIWKCTARNGDDRVDPARLAEAWRSVVRKHSILSTVFAPAPDGAGFIQLVLSDREIEVICLQADDKSPEIALAQMQRPLWKSKGLPRHVFTMLQSGLEIACRLDINHALIDGGSLNPLVEDLEWAYSGIRSAQAPPFVEMIKYLARSSRSGHVEWWAEYLREVKPCEVHSVFKRPVKDASRNTERFSYADIPKEATSGILGFCKLVGITRSVFLQVAWAMLLSYLTESSEICFGYLASGRDAPIEHVERMVGPLANMLISRIDLSGSASSVLQQASDDSTQHLLHQHVSLAHIQHAIGLQADQRLFNTAMTLREADRFSETNADGSIGFDYHCHQDPHEFDLLLSARIDASELKVSIQLPDDLLDKESTDKLVLALSSAIHILLSSETNDRKPAGTQRNEESLYMKFKSAMNDPTSQKNLDLIWSWNSPLPEPIRGCIQDQIHTIALQNSDRPAVCAWDGDLTYGQLEKLSSKVANNLRTRGIGRGDIVPVCFEKSMWMPVAALGVIKAGAAVVALDITLPEKRLQAIIDQTQRDVVVTSVTRNHLAGRLGAKHTLVLPNTQPDMEDSGQINSLPASSPEDLLYLVFTSGSTGTPKGTMLTHGHICSMLHYQCETLGLDSTSRVYNFASYAFDVAWDDFFHALTCGGCLCIPSEEDRKNDIEASMATLQANYAHITPTILRHLDWNKLGEIAVVNLSGEPVLPSDRCLVSCQTKVFNSYGPAETNVVTIQDLDKLSTPEVSIGKGLGAATWIVDLGDINLLAPIGQIGELWIEGPLSGLGYLKGTADFVAGSTEAWIENPIWLAQGSEKFQGRSGRLYRTGDRVRYADDGFIIYCGRADRQIKVSGQRVELGEVQVALQTMIKTLGPDWSVVIEAVQPLESETSVIMAFIAPSKLQSDKDEFKRHIVEQASQLRKQLCTTLPEYMVPKAIIPLMELPLTPTGKVDFKELKAYGSSKSLREWTIDEESTTEPPQAMTESKKVIAGLFKEVLKLPETASIGAGDNFFRLGGDSVFAMRLVSKARALGVSLTVRDVFRNPAIADLAGLAGSQQSPPGSTVIPSVSNGSLDSTQRRGDAANICNVSEEKVLDLLPCTPLQRNIASWAAAKGEFRTTHTMQLEHHVDINLFRHCWNIVAERNPIMRTRVVDLPGHGYMQVIIDEIPEWIRGRNIEECQQELLSRQARQKDRLVHLAIAEDPTDGSKWFLWRLHWAAYDGWSLRLLLTEAESLYHGQTPDPFNDMRLLANSLHQLDSVQAESYWKDQVSGVTAASLEFPPEPQQGIAAVDHDYSIQLEGFSSQATGFTATTLIRTGLAIVLARYLQTDQVVFGATVTGRQGSVAGLDRVAGPAFATLPICLSVQPDVSDTSDLLDRVQSQMVEMIPFEQTDLEYYRNLTREASIACDFKVLLVVQSHIPEHDARSRDSSFKPIFTDGLIAGNDAIVELGWRSGRRLPMFVECQLQESGHLLLRLRVDSRSVDKDLCLSLLQQLGQEISRLSTGHVDEPNLNLISSKS